MGKLNEGEEGSRVGEGKEERGKKKKKKRMEKSGHVLCT